MKTMRLQGLAAAAALALSLGSAEAQPTDARHAGYRTMTVPGDMPIHVALFYPTTAPERQLPIGPWQLVAAPGAPVAGDAFKGLVLVSHGTGSHELAHHNLATRLAREGYLVAAVRHPGDHWEDRSLVASGGYFGERPRQVSRVLDALLAAPEWGTRIPKQRIGAVGHSAGGYTVLALAGAEAEPGRAATHCRTVRDDPIFCALGAPLATGRSVEAGPLPPPDGPRVSVSDPRIRAVVALAPLAVVFTPESLRAVRLPVRIVLASHDAVLAEPYHGTYAATHLPTAQTSTVDGAGHFAFMAQSPIPLPSDAGDAAANPPGFDRVAYLPELESQVTEFFARAWR